MPADYNGRWEMVSNENFEDVMKALGKLFYASWDTVEVWDCDSSLSLGSRSRRVYLNGSSVIAGAMV